MNPTPTFLAVHFLGASVFWASGFILIKILPELAPLPLSALRAGLATAALALWFGFQRVPLLPARGQFVDWLILGSLNGWMPNVLTAFALASVPAGQAAMIQAVSPLMVAAAAPLIFVDERPTARRIAGIVTGFAGMALLTGPAALGEGAGSIAGFAAMIGSAACYAAGALHIRSIKVAVPAQLAYGQQLFSAVPALGLALAIDGPSGFAPAVPHWPAVLALGVLGTALPNVFFMRLMRAAGPTRGSLVSYLIPVWATVLGVAFIGETVSLREIGAGLVILVGVWIASHPAARPADR